MSRIPRSLKKITMTVATGALAATGLLAAPGAAQAASYGPIRIAPDSNQFLFFDVSGGSTGDGAKIIQWSLSGSNQGWNFKAAGGNTFQIVNVKSGKCMTTDGVAGHQLYQWACSTDSRQLWYTSLDGTGTAFFIESVFSHLFVDVSGDSRSQGAAIDTWYENGASNQTFWPRNY
jgi:hypothetical protein